MTYVKFERIEDPYVFGYRAQIWKLDLYVEVVRHYESDWRIYITQTNDDYWMRVAASNLTARHGSYCYQEAMSLGRKIAAGVL